MTIPAFRRKKAPALRQRDFEKQADERRGSRQERGYDAEWDRLRARYRRHINGLCEECQRRGIVAVCDVIDHIIPVRDAPDRRLDWKNLQGLCNHHHNGWKRRMESYARKTRAISMLEVWCKHPDMRPAAFQFVRRGPAGSRSDGDKGKNGHR